MEKTIAGTKSVHNHPGRFGPAGAGNIYYNQLFLMEMFRRYAGFFSSQALHNLPVALHVSGYDSFSSLMEERRLEADAGLWLLPSPAEHLRRTQGETDGRMKEEGKAWAPIVKAVGADAGSRKESTLKKPSQDRKQASFLYGIYN